MGQGKLPACALCGFEARGLPDRKQDLVQKYIGRGHVWLHLQCEKLYRDLEKLGYFPHPEFHGGKR